MKFIWYQRITTGKWAIMGGEERPETKGSEGARRKIKQITEVDPEFQSMTLGMLEKIYPLKLETSHGN